MDSTTATVVLATENGEESFSEATAIYWARRACCSWDPATGWNIRGRQAGHVIEIEMPGGRGTSADALQGYGSWRQAGERWLRIPCRPNNTQAKYGRKIYSSAWPLGVPCDPDASPSRR